jgi:hypothetical protein
MVEKITTEDSPASGTVQRSFTVESRQAQHCLAHGLMRKMAALGLPQLIRSAKEFGGQVESAGELVAAAWKSGLADRVVRLWVRCP